MNKTAILLMLCGAVLALCTGCAAPGAPLPPSLRLPETVNNLSAVRQGRRVELRWTPPSQTTDHLPIREASTTRICRVVNRYPIAECGNVVAQVEASELISAEPTARRPLVMYVDVLSASLLEPPNVSPVNEATYAIKVVNRRGRSAGLSNQVSIPLVATEPPPTAFRVSLDAEGPLLQWKMTSSFPSTPEIACQVRIYRRSVPAAPQGESEFVKVGSQPCQTGPGEARDPSFEWEKEYEYELAVATTISWPGRPPVEVVGDASNVVPLTTQDVFPPAVPSGVQAVFSSVGQKPFIDLTWVPDTESDLAGYIVYRRTEGTSFARVSSELVKSPAWRDADVKPGETYFYAVAAVDVRGNQSAQSAPATERVPLEVP